jgi:glycosyltransferase involved in cell wall biosynthesis
VLTVKEEYYVEANFNIDQTLVKDLPSDLVIYRTKIGSKSFFLKSLLNGLPTRWLKTLFFHIGKIIKSEKPDLIFATGDPFFPLLIAPFTKRFFGLKYVVDFRDPWKLAIPDHPPVGLKGKIFQPVNNFLEPKVVNSASRVIVVSEAMAVQYRAAYPNKKASDFVVIPNGYDPDDYDSVPIIHQDQFTIIYAGKFLTGNSFRNPSNFLEALLILKKKNIKVKFLYIGEENQDLNRLVDQVGVRDLFEPVGRKTYHDTISYMKGAGLLLLIGSGQETEQTAKIFDYLGCKRPILALASEKGGIADVVKGVEKISLIENKDASRIAGEIEAYYNAHSNELIERSTISHFQRKEQAKRLANVFDEVLNEKG